MPLTPLTTVQLANFLDLPPDELSTFARSALEFADIIVQIRTGISSDPKDPFLKRLVELARLDLAYALYVERQYIEYRVNPFQSETIGSYSYSKGNTASGINSGKRPTGITWLDLLLDYLDQIDDGESGIVSGSISVFEFDGLSYTERGHAIVLGPRERLALEGGPYYVGVQEIHDPNVAP